MLWYFKSIVCIRFSSKSEEFKFERSVNFDGISKAGNDYNCEGNSILKRSYNSVFDS